MPRRPRIWPAGMRFHVLNRAARRLTLFEKADDCEAFERVLADAIAREHLPIFAWTVRLNHLHFVLRPETDSQLSDFFRWLTHTHTMRWHAHSHTEGTGHLYQGRFKTFPIEAGDHLLTVLRYVERNPLRTSLCERAEDWRYGSLWRRNHGTPEQQQTLSEWPIARPRQWVAHVNRAQSEAELTALRSSVRKGTPFGGHRLVIQSAARLQLEHTSLSVETAATDKDVRRTNRETISGQFLLRPEEEDTRCAQFFELGALGCTSASAQVARNFARFGVESNGPLAETGGHGMPSLSRNCWSGVEPRLWVYARWLTQLAILTVSVIHDSAGIRAEDVPSYLKEIRPILAANCFPCHGPDAKVRQAGLRLDQGNSARMRLESGMTAIVAGKPADSELIRRIEIADTELLMPPPESRKLLTAAEKYLLRRWIESGAKSMEHWAYVAPQRSRIPLPSHAEWVRNPVDAFVLAQIEASGMAPSPMAGRETLLRRVSLDLIGLPPTLEELEMFLSDSSPDAYERAVDRLLASPHFGEKLAQEWLDLARFGDTSGYQDDNDRPNHPYRDVVIGAFNANLPFDQFTIESLAGDLLAQPTLTQKVLSGFNRLHRYNEEGGSDPEEFRVVYAVDRTNTTAATWMGVSFGCAQCHDHKYDPFTQREYYQLLAFFNSLKGEITVSKGPANPPQIPVPDPAQQERIDELSRLIAQQESKLRARESQTTAAFEEWLKQPLTTPPTENSAEKPGAIGGTVARTARPAWYADTKLAGVLTLDTPLRSTGRVTVIRTVNNDVTVGHFARNGGQGIPSVGWAVAEGPRFFAHLALPNGTVIHSTPIAGEHGVEYDWRCTYDPSAGKITLELHRDGKPAGTTSHVLTTGQRNIGLKLDAFGIAVRGLTNQDSPIDLILDDLEYTVSSDGKQRAQNFDRDPQWTGEGNQADGHKFGYDPLATTKSPEGLSVAQLRSLPADKRTEQHLVRLRQHYLREFAPDVVELQSRLSSLRKEIEARQQGAPLALVWEEMDDPRPTQILTRGDYQQPGELVERGVPAIFPALPANAPRNRLALTRWLVDGKHPLTARVAVNRYWKLAFGAGLVRTPDDFGVRGEMPTHPELLDWLAVEFQNGWDVKRLLRLLVTSATYRQSSNATRALRERDPDNRLLARGARFRLSAEEIRDAALTTSGLLSRNIGGRSVFPYQPDHFYRDKEDDPNEWKWPVETGSELYRRGLYTFIRRTSPYPSFQTFDFSGRGECTVARARTNTPLQALVTLNDPVFIEAARVLAERAVSQTGPNPRERLIFLVRTVLSRSPLAAEQTVLERLYQTEFERYHADLEAAAKVRSQGSAPQTPGLDAAEVAAWTTIANALFNLDEAITRE